MIVAVAGHINHGKDEVANALESEAGFYVLRWSDELREEVLSRLRRTLKEVVRWCNDDHKLSADLRWTGVHDLDEDWWERRLRLELWTIKRPIVRALLQEYGTEVRRADYAGYWVDRWRDRLCNEGHVDVVAPDTRYPNEVHMARSLGGYVVLVTRPGAPVDLSHESERLPAKWAGGWDYVFVNDGTVADLHAKVRAWYRSLLR